MKKIVLLIFITIATVSYGQEPNSLLNKKIDNYINEISTKNDIPGLALAIIKNGIIVHKKYYGFSNLDYEIPVNDKTKFPLFSTSKIFASVAIHKLIEQNKLRLTDEISEYLNDLPADWRNIQIKNLLSHSSGLPEIAVYESEPEDFAKSKVYKGSMKFDAGKQFDYNQTNFWLLNRITKKLTNKSLADYVMEIQFSASDSSAIFEGNSLAILKNRATSYSDYPKKGYLRETDYNNPKYLYGASGFNITLNGFIDWDRKFDNNQIINKNSKSRLFEPFNYKDGRLYTNGWYMDKTNGNVSYYYTGSFSTGYKKYIEKKLTIIFLTNGSRELLSVNKIMKHLAGIINRDLVETEKN